MTSPFFPPRRAAIAAAVAAVSLLAGCAPILVGGAVAGSAMVATDRRSAGTQVDDSTNEVKALSAIDATIGDRGHVNATSYNRVVLLTGEVPSEAAKAAVEKAVSQIGTVRGAVNDLAVMPNSSFTERYNDSVITGKVKAAIFDAKDLSVTSIKIVTERGNVYLLGLVTEAEAGLAVGAARVVGGVQKVVRVFQVITPAELAAIQSSIDPKPAAPAASAASAPGST
ncbi:MAG: BON domain-containing protein [Ideonella sp.]|nr:BON domain-containing protein [Ideonella sp.]